MNFFQIIFIFPYFLCVKIIKEQLFVTYNSFSIHVTYEDLIGYGVIFDINIPFSYTVKFNYGNAPINNETKEIEIERTKCKASYMKGLLKLSYSNQTIEDFSIYLVYPEGRYLKSSAFGLGYKNIEPEFSVLYHLYQKGLIDKLAFGIGMSKINEFGVDLYLGGFPKSLIKGTNYISLKVDDRFGKWGIELREIFFGNETKDKFVNTFHAYLASDEDRVFAPSEFMHYINRNIFKEYYINRSCTFYEDRGSHYINCKCNTIHNFPPLKLVIGEYIINLSWEHSFIDLHRQNICLFLIQTNFENTEEWKFGLFFYNKYFTEFDVDNKKIILYSNTEFLSEKKFKINLQQGILIIIIVLLLILIVNFLLLSFVYYYRK